MPICEALDIFFPWHSAPPKIQIVKLEALFPLAPICQIFGLQDVGNV
jgi:hypothetical protein